MNPQQNQTPVDYLNQIAGPAQKKLPFRFTLKTVILAAIAVLIVILAISTIAGAINSSRKEPWEQLSARLAATTTVVANSSSLIKDSQLRSLNSNLKLYLENTTIAIETPLTKIGVDSKKLPESVTKKVDSAGVTGRLEDGRLNAKYDSTYAREMSYQLATILSLYQKLYESSSAETQVFLKSSYDNLLPTQQALVKFSSSTE